MALTNFTGITNSSLSDLDVYKLVNGHESGSPITSITDITTAYAYGNEPDPEQAGTDYFNVFYFVSASSINTGSTDTGYEISGTTAQVQGLTVSLYNITGTNMYAIKVSFPERYEGQGGQQTYYVGISLKTNDAQMSPHTATLSITHNYCHS